MDATSAVLLSVLVIVGICLGSRRVRTYLTMIALRRFFDRYLQQPRHRVHFPDDPDQEEK